MQKEIVLAIKPLIEMANNDNYLVEMLSSIKDEREMLAIADTVYWYICDLGRQDDGEVWNAQSVRASGNEEVAYMMEVAELVRYYLMHPEEMV